MSEKKFSLNDHGSILDSLGEGKDNATMRLIENESLVKEIIEKLGFGRYYKLVLVDAGSYDELLKKKQTDEYTDTRKEKLGGKTYKSEIFGLSENGDIVKLKNGESLEDKGLLDGGVGVIVHDYYLSLYEPDNLYEPWNTDNHECHFYPNPRKIKNSLAKDVGER